MEVPDKRGGAEEKKYSRLEKFRRSRSRSRSPSRSLSRSRSRSESKSRWEEEETVAETNKQMNGFLPFAVVGSNDFVKVGNKMMRARQYPWGVVQGR